MEINWKLVTVLLERQQSVFVKFRMRKQFLIIIEQIIHITSNIFQEQQTFIHQ